MLENTTIKNNDFCWFIGSNWYIFINIYDGKWGFISEKQWIVEQFFQQSEKVDLERIQASVKFHRNEECNNMTQIASYKLMMQLE